MPAAPVAAALDQELEAAARPSAYNPSPMEAWLEQVAYNAPYVVIIGIILLSGFGLPLPEDIPLIAAGYLAGIEIVNPWVMFPACFFAIVGADFILYLLGRRYGEHVPKVPLIRRFITMKRLQKAEEELAIYGGKFIFVARFLPGLRAPAMFAAGVFKVPAWKFLGYDGAAAMVSVPLILALSYYFAEHLDAARKWIHNGQLGVGGLAIVVVVTVVIGRIWFKRRKRVSESAA